MPVVYDRTTGEILWHYASGIPILEGHMSVYAGAVSEDATHIIDNQPTKASNAVPQAEEDTDEEHFLTIRLPMDVMRLANMTPAQAEQYVLTKVNNLAEARKVLALLAKIVTYLLRKEIKNAR